VLLAVDKSNVGSSCFGALAALTAVATPLESALPLSCYSLNGCHILLGDEVGPSTPSSVCKFQRLSNCQHGEVCVVLQV
jgi:hypothetical protein